MSPICFGDKFAHPQEHFFDCIYSFWYNADGTGVPAHGWDGTPFHLNRGTGRQQCRCIVPKAVYTFKKCSWGWENWSPETCRADLKRLLNGKVVASCWLFTSLYWWHTVTQTSSSNLVAFRNFAKNTCKRYSIFFTYVQARFAYWIFSNSRPL